MPALEDFRSVSPRQPNWQPLPIYSDITSRFEHKNDVTAVYEYDQTEPANNEYQPPKAPRGGQSLLNWVVCLRDSAPYVHSALRKRPFRKQPVTQHYFDREQVVYETINSPVLPRVLASSPQAELLLEGLPGVPLNTHRFKTRDGHSYTYGSEAVYKENLLEFFQVLDAAGQALQKLHQDIFSFNDVKESQFLIWVTDAVPQAFLVDPAMAILPNEEPYDVFNIADGIVAGTKPYMHMNKWYVSSEAEARQLFSPRGDIHAFAVMTFAGLVGRRPFAEKNIGFSFTPSVYYKYVPITELELPWLDSYSRSVAQEILEDLNLFFKSTFDTQAYDRADSFLHHLKLRLTRVLPT